MRLKTLPLPSPASAHSVVLLSLPGQLLLSLQNGKSTLGLLLTLWGVIGAW